MNRLLFVVIVILAQDAAANGEPSAQMPNRQTLTFLFENDLFGDTDAQYTNGLKINWLSPDLKALARDGAIPDFLLGWVQHLNAFESALSGDPGRRFNLGLALGQMMFTPDDTQSTALVRDDRPYAGWLYGAVSFVSKSATVADTLEIQLGVIGPASLAEDAQRLVHDIRDLPRPRGWNHQLDNEPGLLIYYERKWRLWRKQFWGVIDHDASAHAGLALGNVADYLALGAEARLGWNLPADFGSSLIRPGGDATTPGMLSGQSGSDVAIYVFSAMGARAIGRDIFLDSNTFSSSHDVDKEPLVGELVVGASVQWRTARLSYAKVLRSREFEGQDRQHSFGSVSLSIAF